MEPPFDDKSAKGDVEMSSPEDQFKINLNQNLWGLIVGLGALGLSERYNLHFLFCFSIVVSIIATISFGFTTVAYTINYWKNKLTK